MEQPYYNLLSRDVVEKEYAELYPRIGLTVFSPLAGGILTGKYSGGVIPEGSRQVRLSKTKSGGDTSDRVFDSLFLMIRCGHCGTCQTLDRYGASDEAKKQVGFPLLFCDFRKENAEISPLFRAFK